MKKLLLILMFMTGVGSFSDFSSFSYSSKLFAQINRTENRIATGVYSSGGKTVVIMLRIADGMICDIAYNKDWAGNWDWKSIYPTTYRRTNWNMDGREYENYQFVATINGTKVFFN